jgi:hypothetical protein
LDNAFAKLKEHIPRILSNPATPEFDPYEEYLNQLFESVNRILENKIIRSLRSTEMRVEPIQLTTRITSDAVEISDIDDFREDQSNSLLQGFFSREDIFPSTSTSAQSQVKKELCDDFSEVFNRYNYRMLLLGQPGAGKTVTLLQYARDAIIKRVQDKTAYLPVMAVIAMWDINTPIDQWLAIGSGLGNELIKMIANGKAVIFLDGLDELGSVREEIKFDHENKQEKIYFDPRKRFIEALNAISLNSRLLITCRIEDYHAIGKKVTLNGAVTLQPMSEPQIALYLRQQPELLKLINSDNQLRGLLETPLLLSIFAFAYEDMCMEERSDLTSLKHAGELRDRVFERYIMRRYRHEELHLRMYGEKLPYSLSETIDILKKLAMYNISGSGSYQRGDNIFRIKRTCNSTDLGPVEFEGDDIYRFTNMMIQLSIFACLDHREEKEKTYRFVHQMLLESLAFRKSMEELQNKISTERQIAIDALGQLKDNRAVTALSDALSIQDPYIPEKACNALKEIGDTRSIPSLAKALIDERSMVCYSEAPATALESLGWQPSTTEEKIAYWVGLGYPYLEELKTLDSSSFKLLIKALQYADYERGDDDPHKSAVVGVLEALWNIYQIAPERVKESLLPSLNKLLSNTNEALPQTNESWLVLNSVGRAPLVPVW